MSNDISEPPGQSASVDDEKEQANKTLTTLIYALQTAGFFVGITFIVAVIINYIKIDDVRGTWFESHFRWQIKTFWFGLLWMIVGLVTFFIIIGYFVLLANTIWVIYRIIKGWLRLSENKPMYAVAQN